jgi:phage tail sheath gpL-like
MTSFNNLTLDNIPFVKLEIDNSLATLSIDQPYRVLLLGETAVAVASPSPVRVSSLASAATAYGSASPLYSMIQTFFKVNGSTPLYVYPFAAGLEAEAFKTQIEQLKDGGQFNIVVSQWDDPAKLIELGKIYDVMGQADHGNDGVVFAASCNTYDELIKVQTLGTLNYKFISVLASPIITKSNASVVTEYTIATNLAAVVAIEAQLDPARPFNGLALTEVPAWAEKDSFSRQQLKNLVTGGFSAYSLSSTGQARIERLVTTWTKDESGLPDSSFSDLNTILISSYLRFSFVNYFTKKYVSQRYKIADDSTLVPPGKPIIQPKTAKAEAINLFLDWEERGLVEDSAVFIESLTVEKKGGSIIFSFKTNYIDQLIGVAGKLFLTR